MEAVLCAHAREFLDRSLALRAAEPVRTNVLGSVATAVATGERTYDDYRWWLLVEGDEVRGLAMRTAPHGMVVSPVSAAGAFALGRAVATHDPQVPSIAGPAAVVTAVLEGLAAGGVARPGHAGRRETVYEIATLRPPTVAGVARRATADDEEVVVRWQRAFQEELGLAHFDAASTMARVHAGAVDLWEDEGAVVAMAGHATPIASAGAIVTRVGPVYTPPARRGHGYAAGVTASVSDRLLAAGHRVMLYADADNPTSNGVYRRLGYVACADVVNFEFD